MPAARSCERANPDDQERRIANPQGRAHPRGLRQALVPGACAAGPCGAGGAPLCAVAYCRRAKASRHSNDRCRDRWHRRALVRRPGRHGTRQCVGRGQAPACRWCVVHRPDQELRRRRKGDHPAGVSMTEKSPRYLSGFGNEHAAEALPGTLPQGQNAPHGLYTEQISGTPFTAPRGHNRRSWLYRIRPSAMHPAFHRIDNGLIRSAPFDAVAPPPNRLRWDPLPFPDQPSDFIDGLVAMGGNGDANGRSGIAIHIYRATKSMGRRVFYDADGELLIVPQLGRLLLATELGVIEAAPGEIAVIPRGVKFRVELLDARARGYVCENYGILFRLPELGPIGANGLANPRDFRTPVAAFEDSDEPCQVVAKFEGNLWATELNHSPLDVVAWHGNYAPYVYDLARFNTLGTVSFDHPDPSIFTVLTAPSDTPGTANCDFVIFPPRW